MKTAVSIPTLIFRRAEHVAKKMKISRSELYAKAVLAFVERESSADITRALNAVYAEQPSSLDSAIQELQARSIPTEKW